jgi:hypothetical protein
LVNERAIVIAGLAATICIFRTAMAQGARENQVSQASAIVSKVITSGCKTTAPIRSLRSTRQRAQC